MWQPPSYREGVDVTVSAQTTILSSDLVSDGSGGYNAVKTIVIDLSSYSISEYRYTTTSPNSTTRGNDYEANLEIDLITEEITVGSGNYSDSVNQGVNSYTGDKNEIISQSPTETQYCDMHFSLPQGLYTIRCRDWSKGKSYNSGGGLLEKGPEILHGVG